MSPSVSAAHFPPHCCLHYSALDSGSFGCFLCLVVTVLDILILAGSVLAVTMMATFSRSVEASVVASAPTACVCLRLWAGRQASRSPVADASATGPRTTSNCSYASPTPDWAILYDTVAKNEAARREMGEAQRPGAHSRSRRMVCEVGSRAQDSASSN